MNEPAVGFVGIGIMGEPMALHVIKAGYRVRVWNRSPEKLRSLIAAGAESCADAREVAQGIATLICMLSDGPTCDKVLFGAAGVVSAMAAGTTVIVMSSIPVETAIIQAQKAAQFGVRYLDAPVSGGSVAPKKQVSQSWWAGPAPISLACSRSSPPWGALCSSGPLVLGNWPSWQIR